MGRKSSAKGSEPRAPQQPPSKSSGNSLMYAVVIIAIVGLAAFALSRGSQSTSPESAAASAAAEKKDEKPVTETASPEAEASARATAAFGPHKQASLPPIPFRGYAPPRPPAVVTAAFEFAAEHPEILSYVPCFCGCQQMGHRGNHDCFVRSRDANGDVVEWEEHGVECAVCIDVATRSRQMYSSGASVTDIRAAIEREFVPTSPVMTPTPKPPAQTN